MLGIDIQVYVVLSQHFTLLHCKLIPCLSFNLAISIGYVLYRMSCYQKNTVMTEWKSCKQMPDH